ncbi:hypothetical protein [Methylobrevis pamukkalensis]|uniref:Uncharacterized protein n=1 Tax=Methylobrevis pamukkalensis TaxID=1439726 RepID=A0A1E3H389_9HYPH|nr:hypothetical protein [Methylobrevis pamukkalensis]ODN70793.1 hypothetical protein A6302_01897 [Methylobrevis pamukkalensis]
MAPQTSYVPEFETKIDFLLGLHAVRPDRDALLKIDPRFADIVDVAVNATTLRDCLLAMTGVSVSKGSLSGWRRGEQPNKVGYAANRAIARLYGFAPPLSPGQTKIADADWRRWWAEVWPTWGLDGEYVKDCENGRSGQTFIAAYRQALSDGRLRFDGTLVLPTRPARNMPLASSEAASSAPQAPSAPTPSDPALPPVAGAPDAPRAPRFGWRRGTPFLLLVTAVSAWLVLAVMPSPDRAARLPDPPPPAAGTIAGDCLPIAGDVTVTAQPAAAEAATPAAVTVACDASGRFTATPPGIAGAADLSQTLRGRKVAFVAATDGAGNPLPARYRPLLSPAGSAFVARWYRLRPTCPAGMASFRAEWRLGQAGLDCARAVDDAQPLLVSFAGPGPDRLTVTFQDAAGTAGKPILVHLMPAWPEEVDLATVLAQEATLPAEDADAPELPLRPDLTSADVVTDPDGGRRFLRDPWRHGSLGTWTTRAPRDPVGALLARVRSVDGDGWRIATAAEIESLAARLGPDRFTAAFLAVVDPLGARTLAGLAADPTCDGGYRLAQWYAYLHDTNHDGYDRWRSPSGCWRQDGKDAGLWLVEDIGRS